MANKRPPRYLLDTVLLIGLGLGQVPNDIGTGRLCEAKGQHARDGFLVEDVAGQDEGL